MFVGKPPFLYPDALESATYSAFVAARASRTPMVYAGANDGMLHAFNATYRRGGPGVHPGRGVPEPASS